MKANADCRIGEGSSLLTARSGISDERGRRYPFPRLLGLFALGTLLSNDSFSEPGQSRIVCCATGELHLKCREMGSKCSPELHRAEHSDITDEKCDLRRSVPQG